MLLTLSIRNLAIIDTLALDFAAGFTVLTGETGAGKSILLDALGLVTGARADAALVRGGETQAEVAAEFSLTDAPGAREWLGAHDLIDADAPDTLTLRRVLSVEGRARAYANGTSLSAAQLKALGSYLLDIFGQSDSLRLTQASVQRDLLDQYAARFDAAHAGHLAAVAEAARRLRDTQARLDEARARAGRNPAEADFLRFQLSELETLAPRDGESDELDAEQKRLTGTDRLLETGGQALAALDDEDSLADRLGSLASSLEAMVDVHAGFGEVAGLLESARVQASEAADTLRRLLDRLEQNPERLAEVEARMAALHATARKHRVPVRELSARMAALEAELGAFDTAQADVERLEAERTGARRAYEAVAGQLSTARAAAAVRLTTALTEAARPLGMAHARVMVEVTHALEPERASPSGADAVSFTFSANPGQPPRALSRVASGGELSRLSLALEVVVQESGGPGTLIFDEVDTGVGGAVAEAVGRQLRRLGSGRQVLCVTHQPQVAALGHAQIAISKTVAAGQTRTGARTLDAPGREAEVARMAGGADISDATRALARDLLTRGQELVAEPKAPRRQRTA